MNPSPKNQHLTQAAVVDLVADITPRVMAHLEAAIERGLIVTVQQAAGLLDTSPETIRQLVGGKLIKTGPRRESVTLADLEATLHDKQTGERPKARKKRRATRPKTGGDGSKVWHNKT